MASIKIKKRIRARDDWKLAQFEHVRSRPQVRTLSRTP